MHNGSNSEDLDCLMLEHQAIAMARCCCSTTLRNHDIAQPRIFGISVLLHRNITVLQFVNAAVLQRLTAVVSRI